VSGLTPEVLEQYRERLAKDALAIVDEMAKTLDLSNSRCSDCGAVRYEKFEDVKSAEALEAVRTRLRRFIHEQRGPNRAEERL
jgi:hypothetical protein